MECSDAFFKFFYCRPAELHLETLFFINIFSQITNILIYSTQREVTTQSAQKRLRLRNTGVFYVGEHEPCSQNLFGLESISNWGFTFCRVADPYPFIVISKYIFLSICVITAIHNMSNLRIFMNMFSFGYFQIRIRFCFRPPSNFFLKIWINMHLCMAIRWWKILF